MVGARSVAAVPRRAGGRPQGTAHRLVWSRGGRPAPAEGDAVPPAASREPERQLESLALPQLSALKMSGVQFIAGRLGPLAACTALRDLDVSLCRSLTDMSALRSCLGLTALDMYFCTGLVDITPLASLSALATLNMRQCCSVADFGALAACTALTDLNLDFCNGLVDLAPLASCEALATLGVWGCGRLTDLSPLCSCKASQGHARSYWP